MVIYLIADLQNNIYYIRTKNRLSQNLTNRSKFNTQKIIYDLCVLYSLALFVWSSCETHDIHTFSNEMLTHNANV